MKYLRYRLLLTNIPKVMLIVTCVFVATVQATKLSGLIFQVIGSGLYGKKAIELKNIDDQSTIRQCLDRLAKTEPGLDMSTLQSVILGTKGFRSPELGTRLSDIPGFGKSGSQGEVQPKIITVRLSDQNQGERPDIDGVYYSVFPNALKYSAIE